MPMASKREKNLHRIVSKVRHRY